MLLLAAISCMMVANPGTPDSKKKKKKEKTETVDSVGDRKSTRLNSSHL